MFFLSLKQRTKSFEKLETNEYTLRLAILFLFFNRFKETVEFMLIYFKKWYATKVNLGVKAVTCYKKLNSQTLKIAQLLRPSLLLLSSV